MLVVVVKMNPALVLETLKPKVIDRPASSESLNVWSMTVESVCPPSPNSEAATLVISATSWTSVFCRSASSGIA